VSDRTGTNSDRAAGQAGMPDRPAPADAPTAAELAHGRHEKANRPSEAEKTAVFDGNPPGTPPWQRGGQAGPPTHQPGSPSRAEAESSATTEVYRPASGVATVAEPMKAPPPAPGPQGAPFGPGPGAPPNGHLPNPFGGSGPPEAMRRNEPPNQPHRPPVGRPTARPTAPVRGRAPRAPRKASLQIRRFDPWSVLKLSLVLSVAMFLMWLVAVGVLYGVLNGMGVWDKLNGTWNDLASVNQAESGAEPLISAGRVFGISAVVGAVNIVLFTAFATVAAFIYNVSADLAGGIEVTLSERD
jgi:hypothetical protein